MVAEEVQREELGLSSAQTRMCFHPNQPAMGSTKQID